MVHQINSLVACLQHYLWFHMHLPISFEFFPPKTTELETKLWHAFEQLTPFAPQFVSVTYGAGGTTRERTHAIVARMAQDRRTAPAAHLTCVSATQAEVNEVIDSYQSIGVHHIVALRGDPPQGQTTYTPHPEGYAYALDLVRGIKARGAFEVSVSAYPEKHPESASFDQDIAILKAKVDAGATRAITQYFFDIAHYERFVELAHKAGVSIPIVPGILPIHNFAQTVAFSARCGASIPPSIHARFEGITADQPTHVELALDISYELCRGLMAAGAPALHFYTLNRADLTKDVLTRLDFPISSR
jgi:methylenetetrahydrofolate reductase (NADPH)